jgi:hypothetical protein
MDEQRPPNCGPRHDSKCYVIRAAMVDFPPLNRSSFPAANPRIGSIEHRDSPPLGRAVGPDKCFISPIA